MAKEEKKAKKDKAGSGAKKAKSATNYYVHTKETVPAFVKANVEEVGGALHVNYRKPRSSTRLDVVLSKDDVIAACIAKEDDGGYIVVDHPTFAGYVYESSINDVTITDGFLQGTDANGNDVFVNTSLVQVTASEVAA